MAFANLKFPELRLKHGISRETIYPVTVTGNGTREIRRAQFRWERHVWSIPSRNLVQADREDLAVFLKNVNFGLHSFLYQDPLFPEYNGHILTYRSGTTWYLTMPNSITSADDHPFLHPQMGELTFKKNGVTTAATLGGTDSTTGLTYINMTGSINTDVITAYGPVYFTVRLDSSFGSTITAMEKSSLGGTCNVVPTVQSINDIRLIEVFE